MAAEKATAEVVVQRGTLHDGKGVYAVGDKVTLPADEAKRLIALGVVALPEVKAPEAPAKEGAQVKTQDGPSMKTAES